MAPMQLRERAWKRLSENININKLEEMTIDTSLDQVEGLANEILQGKVRGRVIVNISE
jgi:acrylyl-CoA reductase (NADPH)